jgi:hypothetical protein
VSSEVFDIQASWDAQRRWLLAVKIQDEDAVSDWESTDDCKTFKRIT